MKRLKELYILRAQIDVEIRREIARNKLRRHNRPIARCGTDSGYYRHKRTLSQPACDECKHAHNEAEKARRRARIYLANEAA